MTKTTRTPDPLHIYVPAGPAIGPIPHTIDGETLDQLFNRLPEVLQHSAFDAVPAIEAGLFWYPNGATILCYIGGRNQDDIVYSPCSHPRRRGADPSCPRKTHNLGLSGTIDRQIYGFQYKERVAHHILLGDGRMPVHDRLLYDRLPRPHYYQLCTFHPQTDESYRGEQRALRGNHKPSKTTPTFGPSRTASPSNRKTKPKGE